MTVCIYGAGRVFDTLSAVARHRICSNGRSRNFHPRKQQQKRHLNWKFHFFKCKMMFERQKELTSLGADEAEELGKVMDCTIGMKGN